jgi:glycosyltransferase involved in cell wall biosynthesis
MTPPRLLVCSLVRNEAGKFWRSALSVWSKFADEILVLDDNSEDNTVELALAAGAKVFTRSGRTAWGAEASARQELFDIAMQEARPKDWVLILDADMVPARDPVELALMGSTNAWAFAVWDLWDAEPLRYRSDRFWQGHEHPRIWMVERPTVLPEWEWPDKGIHVGHLPSNFEIKQPGPGIAPLDYGLIHYAYSNKQLRDAKLKQYESVRDLLSNWQWAHSLSIGDPNPATYSLPFTPQYELKLEPPMEAAA